jgi:hypothetical protein
MVALHIGKYDHVLIDATPNARAKGRAAGMLAKHDDASRRVPLSALFGGCQQRTTGLKPPF